VNEHPFACPQCRLRLEAATPVMTCKRCGRAYEYRDGIHRFLPVDDLGLGDFHQQYRQVRDRDGSRADTAARRGLPQVDASDPRADHWAIRRCSVERLRAALRGMRSRAGHRLRVADLGAGNGWLSSRLAAEDVDPFAVDRLDDDLDGLGACREDADRVVCVQADFNALPFTDGAFDAVVLNGSLHYSADPAATLAEARRVLSSGGALVVMDSPMFSRERDGEAMVATQLQRIADEHGIPLPVRPGVGFLTFAALDTAASALGMEGRFFPSRGPLGWRLRREIGRLRLGRAPAAFGVWVAQ
jgi:SAM-dependent methyltransferase